MFLDVWVKFYRYKDYYKQPGDVRIPLYVENTTQLPTTLNVRSLQVGAGACVVMYKYKDYGGKNQTYCVNTQQIDDNWRFVNSMKLVKGKAEK